jgi:ubiquinone/menaquinone biosynthesis C-methylase UbiE
MGIMEIVGKQAGMPQGRLGGVVMRMMNISHGRLTTWGLGHVEIRGSDTILDIGCGGGKTVSRLAKMVPEGKVYGIDYSEDCVRMAIRVNRSNIDTGRVEISHASVESLPFSDGMFDLVTAVETTYFWPDLVGNFSEVRRVLKPGGHFIMINEVYRDEKFERRNAAMAKAFGFNYHRPEEYEAFLRETGFSDIRTSLLPEKNWITAVGVKDDD